MKTLIFTTLIFFIACSNDKVESIYGSWKCIKVERVDSLSALNEPSTITGQFLGIFISGKDKDTLVFRADDTYDQYSVAFGIRNQTTGTYVFSGYTKKLVLTMQDHINHLESINEFRIIKHSEDSLIFVDNRGFKFVYLYLK